MLTAWSDHDAIFFSGGGLKVVAFLGALELADLSGCAAAYGVSAGAMLACLLACGMSVERVKELFLQTHWAWLFYEACSLDRLVAGKTPMDGQKMRALLGGWLLEAGAPPHATLGWLQRNRSMGFGCFAADLEGGTMTLFEASTHPEAHLVEVIMASMALPPMMEPVSVLGRLHVDAGICNNAPLSLLRKRARKTLALLVNTGPEKKLPQRAMLLWARCNMLTQAELLTSAGESCTVLEMPSTPASAHLFRVTPVDMTVLIGQGRVTALARLLEKEIAGLCCALIVLLAQSTILEPQPADENLGDTLKPPRAKDELAPHEHSARGAAAPRGPGLGLQGALRAGRALGQAALAALGALVR